MRKYALIRATPIQQTVLDFASARDWHPDDNLTDQQRRDSLQKALVELRKRTSQDFGWDLEQWHQYLLNSPEFNDEYTYGSHGRGLASVVSEFARDPRRERLIREIEGENRSA